MPASTRRLALAALALAPFALAPLPAAAQDAQPLRLLVGYSAGGPVDQGARLFGQALSKELGEAGMTAESIDTQAKVTLDKVDGGFEISTVHLSLRAKIPGADLAAFEKAVETAKTGCPVSKVLNAAITLEAVLEN